MSCAQGSPGSEPGQRAHRPCSPASVRTGPAGIPVRGCVDVRSHTREAREPRAYHSCTPLPPALPSSSSFLLPQFRTVGKKIAPNCPTNPTNFGLVFRSPQTLGVCGELMSNISATRGHPGMRICVCGSPRGDLSHIASLTLGCSRSDFSGANLRAQDHTCGVGLTQQIT
jgi:hypothetical protein